MVLFKAFAEINPEEAAINLSFKESPEQVNRTACD